MPLNDPTIKNAKPTGKAYRLSDEKGLYLEVSPNGGKWWRLKYRFDGKEKRLSLGTYPEVGLKLARERRDEARKQLADGIDPSIHRQATKATRSDRAANSFEVLAREWHQQRHELTPKHAANLMARLERDIFPWLGSRPVMDITGPEVLAILRRMTHRGATESAHRAKCTISQIMRFAVATGRAERDPCPDLRGALPQAKKTHFPAVTDPARVGELLRQIDGYHGTLPVTCALRLAPLVFVRPGELRHAKWEEIDLDAATWRFLVTKTKVDHLVPLAHQAVSILRELHPLTGRGTYLFPSSRTTTRPMSDNTILSALRRLGIPKEEMVGHGFRAMARTLLAEQLHFKPEVIEHQLSHRVPDTLGAAYNRTKFLKERVAMMQSWADYLDTLKDSNSNVVPIGKAI
jgi:integrase